MDTLIKELEYYSLWKISELGLRSFISFVANANYRIHQRKDAPESEIENAFLHEKELFPYSNFYAIKTKKGEYIGAIRSTLWNRKIFLPMDRDFKININEMLKKRNLNPPEIWHVARLAIDEVELSGTIFSLKQRSEILRILLMQVFAPICKRENNILIAESDAKFYKKVKSLNINSELIGEPQMYLGSVTIPILNTGKGLSLFFEKNRQYCYV